MQSKYLTSVNKPIHSLALRFIYFLLVFEGGEEGRRGERRGETEREKGGRVALRLKKKE